MYLLLCGSLVSQDQVGPYSGLKTICWGRWPYIPLAPCDIRTYSAGERRGEEEEARRSKGDSGVRRAIDGRLGGICRINGRQKIDIEDVKAGCETS